VSESLWIAIAVIAVLVVVALVVGLVRYRRRRISLSSADTATPIDRSGGYTASSGITFSQSAPAEPVERIDTSGLPAVGDDATVPRDAPKRPIADVQLPEAQVAPPEPSVAPAPEPEPAPAVEEIAPPEGRLDRLRGRLAKSQNTLGRGVLGLLGAGDLDEESWEAVEDTLLIADLGPVVAE
jgi:fused signal recognition particle receptor